MRLDAPFSGTWPDHFGSSPADGWISCRNAGGVFVDLVEELFDGAGVELVVAVPAAVAVGQYSVQG